MRGRVDQMQSIDDLISDWSRGFSRDALFEHLTAYRVPNAPVRTLSEVLGDAHLHQRGMLFEIDHPRQGRITVCRSPLHFAGLRQVDYQPSPEYGGDNDLILGETLGIDADTRAALRAEGVI